MSAKLFFDYIKKQKEKIMLSIGEIELTKQIGQGGNGIVYKALFHNNEIAIKFLISDASGKTLETKKKRFLAEYFNVITLKNLEGIVRYINFDLIQIEDENGIIDIPVILMQLYEGSLNSMPIDENQKESMFIKLFNFLIININKIHKEGIIHRDLKPENVLYKEEEFVLADFGIASYNPELFKVRAETQNKERVGNRLFSAPEQEKKGVTPHVTMDIYAIGQILQWFMTKETHRGTNRRKINFRSNKLSIYNNIIDKCLSQNPEDRFQSIQEIVLYIEKSKTKTPFDYIRDFNRIIRQNFPKDNNGFCYTDNKDKIDNFFNQLKEKEELFYPHLWFHDSYKIGNDYFKLKQVENAIWRFNELEFTIKALWTSNSPSSYNDFILIHYDKGIPFEVKFDEEIYRTYLTYLVDDIHNISSSEYNNNFADIDGEIVDLSNHTTEMIHRQEEEGFIFIGLDFHCILQSENDENVEAFVKKLHTINGKVSIQELSKFREIIRQNKNSEITLYL